MGGSPFQGDGLGTSLSVHSHQDGAKSSLPLELEGKKKKFLSSRVPRHQCDLFYLVAIFDFDLENRLLKNPFTAACLNYSLTAFHKEPINQLGLARREGLP